MAARLLADRLRYRVQGEAFAAGILHDIGKLILSQYFTEEFEQILSLTRDEGLYIGRAEKLVLGVTHTQIGLWLADKWNLPDKLVTAIAYHHKPGRLKQDAELASLIHLADFLCRREKIGDGGGGKLPPLDPAALRTFGIYDDPKAALYRIFSHGEQLQEEMDKADIFTRIARGQLKGKQDDEEEGEDVAA